MKRGSTSAALRRWSPLVAIVVAAGVWFGALASAGGRVSPPAGCPRGAALPASDGPGSMAFVPGGTFTPGSTGGYGDERPAGPVTVGAFWVDRTEVTNAEFAAFVTATGHRTVAEREGASGLFIVPEGADRDRENGWWRRTPGASWRHPEGPGSDLVGRERHPVVHVALSDALAYARWRGRDLPTEAEWEHAARAGGVAHDGEPRDAGGPRANYWQGEFPGGNSAEDGFVGTSPVACFPPDARGLFDMIGNVWEWTTDRYATWAERAEPGGCHAAGGQEPRVLKGGSHLCARSHCVRFRAAARHAQEPDVPTSHIGFRTVVRVASTRQRPL